MKAMDREAVDRERLRDAAPQLLAAAKHLPLHQGECVTCGEIAVFLSRLEDAITPGTQRPSSLGAIGR